jgi:hypothetical protein
MGAGGLVPLGSSPSLGVLSSHLPARRSCERSRCRDLMDPWLESDRLDPMSVRPVLACRGRGSHEDQLARHVATLIGPRG